MVWLFNLYMAYKVNRSKACRVIVAGLYLVALVCRAMDASFGGGILWR